MKRLILLVILILCFCGCSAQHIPTEAEQTAYEDGYYDAIHDAPIGDIDEARHDEIVDYITEYSWTEVVDAIMEDDPQIILEYIDDYPPVNLEPVTFIANTSSFIYHKKDCSHVKDISEENILYWCDSEDALIQAGYAPCSDCIKPETPVIHTYDLDAIAWVDTPDSSAFNRVGYNESTKDLVVEFKKSGLYVYSDVPEEIWAGLMAADSKGGYYNQEIKGHYKCAKIILGE